MTFEGLDGSGKTTQVELLRAALDHDPQKAGGLADALQTLQRQPQAPLLLGAVALSVDSVNLTLARRQLQRTADSGALAGAYELRSGIPTGASPKGTGPDMIRSMTTGLWLDFLGVRLQSEKVEGQSAVINFVTPEHVVPQVIEAVTQALGTFDAQHGWERSEMITAGEVMERLREGFTLTPDQVEGVDLQGDRRLPDPQAVADDPRFDADELLTAIGGLGGQIELFRERGLGSFRDLLIDADQRNAKRIERYREAFGDLRNMPVDVGAFIGLQRWLARRIPGRRVRNRECPFCGHPVRGAGPHCEGCGREVLAACAACEQPRRVGASYCAQCGSA